jgi:hypothetical protein
MVDICTTCCTNSSLCPHGVPTGVVRFVSFCTDTILDTRVYSLHPTLTQLIRPPTSRSPNDSLSPKSVVYYFDILIRLLFPICYYIYHQSYVSFIEFSSTCFGYLLDHRQVLIIETKKKLYLSILAYRSVARQGLRNKQPLQLLLCNRRLNKNGHFWARAR